VFATNRALWLPAANIVLGSSGSNTDYSHYSIIASAACHQGGHSRYASWAEIRIIHMGSKPLPWIGSVNGSKLISVRITMFLSRRSFRDLTRGLEIFAISRESRCTIAARACKHAAYF
jgi:hypothetical protein